MTPAEFAVELCGDNLVVFVGLPGPIFGRFNPVSEPNKLEAWVEANSGKNLYLQVGIPGDGWKYTGKKQADAVDIV